MDDDWKAAHRVKCGSKFTPGCTSVPGVQIKFGDIKFGDSILISKIGDSATSMPDGWN
jgi:hypothetical protein